MRRIKVLHIVGHLNRGGIETWLHQVVRRSSRERLEHFVLVWTREEEAMTAALTEAGARVLPLPGHRDPLRLVRGLGRLQARHGPFDVAHSHGTHGQGFAMLAAAALGIRHRVVHSHNDIRPALRERAGLYGAYAAAGGRALRRLASRGLAVTEGAAESAFGPAWRDDPRVSLHLCGIDLERFRIEPPPDLRAELGIPEGRVVIGHVGRFNRAKNQGFILEVAAAALMRGLDLHLLLVGDGILRPMVEGRVEALGLAERVTVLRDRTDVPDLMRGAMDVFLLPSLHEGMVLVATEAQVAGLPLLASDGLDRGLALWPERVRWLDLAAGAEAWARELEDLPPRGDPAAAVAALRGGPFDVAKSAADLERVYLDLAGPRPGLGSDPAADVAADRPS